MFIMLVLPSHLFPVQWFWHPLGHWPVTLSHTLLFIQCPHGVVQSMPEKWSLHTKNGKDSTFKIRVWDNTSINQAKMTISNFSYKIQNIFTIKYGRVNRIFLNFFFKFVFIYNQHKIVGGLLMLFFFFHLYR